MKYKDAIIALILLAIFLVGLITTAYYLAVYMSKVLWWIITTILIWRL